MHISKFRIHNYKSYLDSGDVYLDEGINIITGQNNAGKTALLQALSLEFNDIPHRSTKTISTPLEIVNPITSLEVEFNLTKIEFMTYALNFKTFSIPRSHLSIERYGGRFFFDTILGENITFKASFLRNGGFKDVNIIGIPNDNSGTYHYHVDKINSKLLPASTRTTINSSFDEIIGLIKQRFYFFHAERLNIGSFKFGNNSTLNSNASNLPEVLEILQGQKMRFSRYLKYVRVIFPQICDISLRPDPSNPQNVEIVVWNESPSLERYDLVVPLSQCGTGLGQVLSILYVVLTSDVPKVIIIDEPNSFLHPGAVRKLVEILKEHPQHQFIISTHSPSTIAAANPKTINIIKTKDAQSYVEKIDVKESNQQQMYLAEIGVKLGDVFGSDNILWVEGKTEEICFPKIIEATEGLSLMGTTILGVKNTGDFQVKKSSDLIFDIYILDLAKGRD